MNQPKHLLVPVDLSEASRAGLKVAAEMARRFDARITVLHVEIATAAFFQVMAAQAAEHAERIVARTREETEAFVRTALGEDHEAKVVVEEGLAVAETIRIHASRNQVDWICMSAAGHSGWARLILGSTAAAVIRQSPVPVLTVRSREASLEFVDFKRVLVAVDLDERSVELVRFGAVLASPKGRLTLMHVIESPPRPLGALYGTPLRIPAENLAAAREWTAGALDTMAKGIEESILEPFKIVDGRAADGILLAEKEIQPDLIVLGTHGRHGTDRLLLGSVAERVVHHASGPVLVVPTRERK